MKKKTDLRKKKDEEAARALEIQDHQASQAIRDLESSDQALGDLDYLNKVNREKVDQLMARALELLGPEDLKDLEGKIGSLRGDLGKLTGPEVQALKSELDLYQGDRAQAIDLERSWEAYLSSLEDYAAQEGLDLKEDPYRALMSEEEEARLLSMVQKEYGLEKLQCDRYDYFFACFSGLITGLVDVFLVGSPIKGARGPLVKLTDSKVEGFVLNFSDRLYRIREGGDGSGRKPATKLQYLEGIFRVPYDGTSDRQLGLDFKPLNMSPSNHHYLSLSHSPTPAGLAFSIFDQVTGKGSYLSNGTFLRASYKTKRDFGLRGPLTGKNLLKAIFIGTANWIGHLISDVAGSSGSIAAGNRGSGLPLPLSQFLQLIPKKRIGSFYVDMPKIARKVFESGYDLRFGMATAIPLALNELLIRFFWALRRYLTYGESVEEIFKTRESPELRRLLLVGHGSLCLVDGIDAGIRTKGFDFVALLTRLNFVAWIRFAHLSFKEVMEIYSRSKSRKERNQAIDREWERLLIESRNY